MATEEWNATGIQDRALTFPPLTGTYTDTRTRGERMEAWKVGEREG